MRREQGAESRMSRNSLVKKTERGRPNGKDNESTGCTGISVNETCMNKRWTDKWDGHERGGCTAAQGESRRALNLRLSKDLPWKAMGRQ